jgi:calcium binding protein 39
MAYVVGKDKKTKPADFIKNLHEILVGLGKEKNQKTLEKLSEEASKNLAILKINLVGGEGNPEPSPELVLALSNEILSQDLFVPMIHNLAKLEFETKKDAANIFCSQCRRQVGNRYPTVEYLAKNSNLLATLVEGYTNPEIALNCGMMLRECIRHEPLCAILLQSESLWRFFSFVELPNFDIASDAFATFKDLLTKHKAMCAEFLEKNYDRVFEEYTKLLNSQNYVTKRQSLKLLGELLLDRANFNVMTKYISQQKNLKLMMLLLRDKSRSIQFEAFHVFKVFVANPNKPKPILDILIKNKEKLLKFLKTFQHDRDDEQFNDEKGYLLKQIEQLS